MRRFIQFCFAFWFGISMTLAQVLVSAAQTTSTYAGSATDESSDSSTSSDSHLDTRAYRPELNESRALSEYLKQRKLPLVGAQVLTGPDGRRMVVLYGFVGSDFGKADAVSKTRSFLHDSAVPVDNRINVRPELLASNRPSSADAVSPGYQSPPAGGYPSNQEESPSTDGSSSYPGPETYKAQQPNPYVQQFTSMLPLIAVLGAIGMSMAGGSSGFTFGSSPFASPSYGNPYSSPYSRYGSPYSGSPFGTSPYSGSPYANPYGSAPYPNP
jgi:hypothetical protein